MPFVADNSVVVAWFVASQGSAETEALLERAVTEDVYVPFIWRAEFAAAGVLAHQAGAAGKGLHYS